MARPFNSPSVFSELRSLAYNGPMTNNPVLQAVFKWPTSALSLAFATYARCRMAFGQAPLSYNWGYDRGHPIHRYYLETFLEHHAAAIRGHCLEIWRQHV